MRKTFFQFLLLGLAFSAMAAYQAVELVPGENDIAIDGCARIARVEVLSTNATGTCSLSIVGRPITIWAETESYNFATNITYSGWTNIYNSVVTTNGSTVVTNRYKNVVATVTNQVVTVTTNTSTVAAAHIFPTNALSQITCAAGKGSSMPTNTFLKFSDRVLRTGTAVGPCYLILER